jgi:putative ABC transport system permease protein
MPERVARYMAGWSNISLNGRALAFLAAAGRGWRRGLRVCAGAAALRVNLVDQLKSGSRRWSARAAAVG